MMLRALSIRQPYAWAVFREGGMTIENRAKPLAQNGLLLIHAAKTFSGIYYKTAQEFCLQQGLVVPSHRTMIWGAIIGAVDVCCEYSMSGDGKWGMPLCYHYKFSDPRLLSNPVHCQGRSGIFYAELPPAAEQELFATESI